MGKIIILSPDTIIGFYERPKDISKLDLNITQEKDGFIIKGTYKPDIPEILNPETIQILKFED